MSRAGLSIMQTFRPMANSSHPPRTTQGISTEGKPLACDFQAPPLHSDSTSGLVAMLPLALQFTDTHCFAFAKSEHIILQSATVRRNLKQVAWIFKVIMQGRVATPQILPFLPSCIPQNLVDTQLYCCALRISPCLVMRGGGEVGMRHTFYFHVSDLHIQNRTVSVHGCLSVRQYLILRTQSVRFTGSNMRCSLLMFQWLISIMFNTTLIVHLRTNRLCH